MALLVPQTGNAAEVGQSLERAARLAVQDLSGAEIDGYDIEVDETDPEKQPQPPVVEPKPYDAEAAKQVALAAASANDFWKPSEIGTLRLLRLRTLLVDVAAGCRWMGGIGCKSLLSSPSVSVSARESLLVSMVPRLSSRCF